MPECATAFLDSKNPQKFNLRLRDFSVSKDGHRPCMDFAKASNCFKSNASVCRNFAILVQNRGENDDLAPITGEPKFRLDFCPFWQNLVASSRDVSEIMFKHPGIEVVVLF